VAFDEMAPDAAAMHLIRHPERFDVLLLQFVIGDVFCDLCAALAGGIGVMGGMNVGRDAAVFEAAHGSAPKHAGHGRANPTALVLSGALMLAHLGEAEASRRVVAAVSEVVARGEHVTYDLGGEASTMDMASAIAEQVRSPARTPTGEPA
jgi:isocitrate dehydrogenase (NAD+)